MILDKMNDFVNKPDDYDFIVYGESRFVIFEKKEENLNNFYYRMRKYWSITRKSLLQTLDSLIDFKKR